MLPRRRRFVCGAFFACVIRLWVTRRRLDVRRARRPDQELEHCASGDGDPRPAVGTVGRRRRDEARNVCASYQRVRRQSLVTVRKTKLQENNAGGSGESPNTAFLAQQTGTAASPTIRMPRPREQREIFCSLAERTSRGRWLEQLPASSWSPVEYIAEYDASCACLQHTA